MIENSFKKFIPVLSIALVFCLLSSGLPLSVLGATTSETAIQESVTKNGVKY